MHGGDRFAIVLSVIMPSFLGDYKNAASDREAKFIRAVDSVVAQTHQDWQLWIVSDGCDRTMDILRERYVTEPRIDATMIAKQEKWSPAVRNSGIHRATGDWILYLDTDDQFGPEHLSIIVKGIQDVSPPNGWGYFNDFAWDPRTKEWVERRCNIDKQYAFGTANLIHRRDLGVWWPKGGGQHDFHFGQMLKRCGEGVRIPTPQYMVCHVPSGPHKYEV